MGRVYFRAARRHDSVGYPRARRIPAPAQLVRLWPAVGRCADVQRDARRAASVFLGWLAYRAQQKNRPWLKNAAAAVAIIILCCVPWTIRNYSVFHQFVPLRSVLGLQLWLGNNDQTQDIFRGDLHPIYNSAEREKYIAMGEIAYMQQKKQEAVAYMLSHPAREATLIFYRAISIWSGGTPYPLEDFIGTPSLRFRWVLACNLVAALGAFCWHDHPLPRTQPVRRPSHRVSPDLSLGLLPHPGIAALSPAH